MEHADVLPNLVGNLARSRPHDVAITEVGGRSTTWAGLEAEAHTWMSRFAGLGIVPGEPVVTLLPTSVDAYSIWLALGRLGALEVPANTRLRGDSLAHVLRDSGARLVVGDPHTLAPVRDLVFPASPPTLVSVGSVTALPPGYEVLTADELFTPELDPRQCTVPAPHDIAALIYTSGTTGPAKGVLVPWAEVREFARALGPASIQATDVLYSTLPPCHVAGKAQLAIVASGGASLVVREAFSVSEFWSDVIDHGCTVAGLIGSSAALLLREPPRPGGDRTCLTRVMMGPLVAELEAFRERFGVDVYTGYGMTEIGAPIATDRVDGLDPASCGRAREGPPFYQVRIVDELDRDVAPGQVGELIVRAGERGVMSAGYWHRPDADAAAWRDGWFRTGDAFRVDTAGNYYFVDRFADSLRVRGENVSCFEVESVIAQHPLVRECAVVAMPSDLGEDDVRAIVVPTGGGLALGELFDWLVPRLAKHMLPRCIEVAEVLPRTDATGRVRKVELRERPIPADAWVRPGSS